MSSVVFVVFSQSSDTVLPIERLAAQARAHFDAIVSVIRPSDSDGACLCYTARGVRGDFDVSIRRADTGDWETARQAERIAAGLADLAARCKAVWTIEARDEPPQWLAFEFSALLASVALGPIVPPDRSTLLGVRSAREHANRLRGGSPLMR